MLFVSSVESIESHDQMLHSRLYFLARLCQILRKPRSGLLVEVIGDVLAVHPHMRGDNASAKSPSKSWAGSPPHAWGQSQSQTPLAGVDRFTPTCVGTMSAQ